MKIHKLMAQSGDEKSKLNIAEGGEITASKTRQQLAEIQQQYGSKQTNRASNNA